MQDIVVRKSAVKTNHRKLKQIAGLMLPQTSHKQINTNLWAVKQVIDSMVYAAVLRKPATIVRTPRSTWNRMNIIDIINEP